MVESRWELVTPRAFQKQYQSKDVFRRKKTQELIELLAQSEHPLQLGEKKSQGYWAARISKDDRLAYYMEGRKLVLLKVCSHKDVYGRD